MEKWKNLTLEKDTGGVFFSNVNFLGFTGQKKFSKTEWGTGVIRMRHTGDKNFAI